MFKIVSVTIPIGPYPLQYLNQAVDKALSDINPFDWQLLSWKFPGGVTTFNTFNCLPVGITIHVRVAYWLSERDFELREVYHG